MPWGPSPWSSSPLWWVSPALPSPRSVAGAARAEGRPVAAVSEACGPHWCSGWSLLDPCGLCNYLPAGGSRVEAESLFNSLSSLLASVPADQKASFLIAQDSRDAPCCKSPVQG